MAAEAVKVIVRCRPLNQREKDLKCKVIVEIDQSYGQCSITNPLDTSAPSKTFSFDGAYDTDSVTEQIYNEIVFPLVESVTEGYNGTVFAYGQTGCGKSFSMQGIPSPVSQRGIIPRAFEHVFEAIATAENTKFLIHASYLEIYNEEIRDLLGKDVKKKLELKEHNDMGVFVTDLSMHPVHDVKSCEKVMEQGWKNRSVGATLMNADSSRSHSIFTIYLERLETENIEDGNIRKGKLNLVDLAGSERQAKTGATGDRLKEATKINLSLSALGNVISALVDGKSKHIPYRDSKLTRLLQDSLGGNTKTLMVACLSPADNNYDETLSTLRYANRAKNIQNKPKINEDPKEALLREYQDEIIRLKSMLTGQFDIDKSKPILDDSVIAKMQQEHDLKMQELVAKYKEAQESNAKLKDDMNRLKGTYEIKQNNTLQTPVSSPDPKYHNGTVENGDIKQIQAQAFERLQALQEQMVGGEKANDVELKAKRAKRKNIAEKKYTAISQALAKLDDDDQLLLKAYGDITEELRAKTLLLKRVKKKIQSLEQEINDLQSEFESDRTDYLETIRKQDQQIKLLSQILNKVQPCLRRDCNYANFDRIKMEGVWDEDLQKWRLPDLIITRTKLPPAGVMPGGRESLTLYRSSSPQNGFSAPIPEDESVDANPPEDRLFQKLEKGAMQDIVANYFKPKRREQLLINANKVKMINDAVNHMESYTHDHQQYNENGRTNGTSPISSHLINTSNSKIHSINGAINGAITSIGNNLNRQYNSKSVPSTGTNKINNSVENENAGGSLSAREGPRKLGPLRIELLPNEGNLGNQMLSNIKPLNKMSRNNVLNFFNN